MGNFNLKEGNMNSVKIPLGNMILQPVLGPDVEKKKKMV